MGIEEKKLNARGATTTSPYEELYSRPLTEEEIAEINFNLVNFVETLIGMDREQQVWIKNQKDQPKETS